MMWIDVKDKDVVLPSMSKVILVTDGQRPQLVTVEKFLKTVDTPYNTWTHWMEIPKTEEELISEEELDELAWNSAKEEYDVDEIWDTVQCDGYTKVIFPMRKYENQHHYDRVCETKEYIDNKIKELCG